MKCKKLIRLRQDDQISKLKCFFLFKIHIQNTYKLENLYSLNREVLKMTSEIYTICNYAQVVAKQKGTLALATQMSPSISFKLYVYVRMSILIQ